LREVNTAVKKIAASVKVYSAEYRICSLNIHMCVKGSSFSVLNVEAVKVCYV